MKLQIIDDDGFIAIVNNDKYKGFVDNNWKFEQLIQHFTDEMTLGHMVMWQTSNDGGGDWSVSFTDRSSDQLAFREFEQLVNVTTGQLFLTNYSDLTMAAQFIGQPIPATHNSDLKIEIENGWYKVTVRQLFDPGNYWEHVEDDEKEGVDFEVVVVPISINQPVQKINSVHWFDI